MRKDDVQQIVTLGVTGRLSRREVITRLAMLGLSTSAIASALAGAGDLESNLLKGLPGR